MGKMSSFRPVIGQTETASADEMVDFRRGDLGVHRKLFRFCFNGVAAICTVFVITAMMVTPVLADTLSDIKEAGVVKFGVKADVKPWAYLDTDGKHVGFEIDLARELAERMGVEAEFTTVTSANRIQYLQQDRVDIVLATMSDTPKRREVVRMIEPHYFGDAANLLAPEGSKFKTWDDIQGATLCAVRGAIYNKWVAEDYNAEVRAFQGPPEAIAALQQNQCEGWVFSDQILRIMVRQQEALKNYTVALEPVNTDYWTMGVSLDSEDDSLAKALSDSIAAMHESGKLLELAKPYDLNGNPFLNSMAKQ